MNDVTLSGDIQFTSTSYLEQKMLPEYVIKAVNEYQQFQENYEYHYTFKLDNYNYYETPKINTSEELKNHLQQPGIYPFSQRLHNIEIIK